MMHRALNLDRFNHRIELLEKGGYSENVNCYGIVPYLYGLQDHPIYLDSDDIPAFLKRHFKPVTRDVLQKGDLISYIEDGSHIHAAVYIKKNGDSDIIFEKEGLEGECRYNILQNYIANEKGKEIIYYTPTIYPIPDSNGNFYICPEHPIGDKIRRVTSICNLYQEELAKGTKFNAKMIDPEKYFDTLSDEEKNECFAYLSQINQFLFENAAENHLVCIGLIYHHRRVAAFADKYNI